MRAKYRKTNIGNNERIQSSSFGSVRTDSRRKESSSLIGCSSIFSCTCATDNATGMIKQANTLPAIMSRDLFDLKYRWLYTRDYFKRVGLSIIQNNLSQRVNNWVENKRAFQTWPYWNREPRQHQRNYRHIVEPITTKGTWLQKDVCIPWARCSNDQPISVNDHIQISYRAAS